MGSHGFEMRVYPRAKTIKSDFTGCQTIWWLGKSGKMQITSRARFQHGSVAELTEFDDDTGKNESRICLYAHGQLQSGEVRASPPGAQQPCVQDFDLRH
jgi:hypothetical protein